MNKKKLYQESINLIDQFLSTEYKVLNTEILNSSSTAVIVVDMLNGFAKEGALYSERVKNLIPLHVKLLEDFSNTKKIFLCDAHPEDASEFNVFLPHCIKNTEEAEIVDALKPFAAKGEIIEKNTTNGYLVEDFKKWLNTHKLENIVIIGCCTDLCILQLALSLKTHYHHTNERVTVMVPIEAVDTYDLDKLNHPGDLTHLLSLKMMQDNGIQLMTTGENYDMV